MNNDKLIVIKRIKEFCFDVDAIVINFPKKEFLIKERILNDVLDILESVVYINYIKSESDVISYKFKLLTKISILNFYLEYLVHKNIINKKIFNKLGRELNEISRLIYGWLKNELYNFEKNKMSILYDLCYKLNNNIYDIGKYNIFLIKYPKYRIIMSLSVTDKIVNHYVTIKYLIPVLSKYLDNRNIATRKNMGTDYGIKLIKKYIEINKKYDKFYILKLDIKKYFYNIDHVVLKNMLVDYFDENVYDLLCKIIDSTDEEYINKRINVIKSNVNSNKVNDLPCCEQYKSLPIGNMTSQFFAIYYLSGLDYFIIHNLHLKY